MADADFGYVGGAPGKIDLYVGKQARPRARARARLQRREAGGGEGGSKGWRGRALTRGGQVVRKAIPSEQACDELIELIKEHGRWVEPARDEEPAAV